jgi:hypothetical protein
MILPFKQFKLSSKTHVILVMFSMISIFGILSMGSFSFAQDSDSDSHDAETTETNEHDTESTESGDHGEEEHVPHALKSVAACSHVTYGSINTVAEQDVSPEIPHFVVPPNGDGPTLVDIGLFVKGISEIDPVHNTFTVEGFIDMIWCDPRESFDPEELGWHEKIFLEEAAHGELSLIWWPDITFPNASGSRDTENLEVIIFEDGTVEYEERFAITLEAHFDLAMFPFDTQHLEIQIESLAWSERYMLFHEEEDMIGLSEEFQLPEWTWDAETDLTSRIEEVQELRDDAPFAEFIVELSVTRRPDFYLLKVFVPMAMIVALSWAVFWMDESDLGDRLGISFTGLLTVVAYQFIIGDTLPHLPYLTFMDMLINFSFVMMALTVVENVLVHILRGDGHMKFALRIDQSSRLIFPILYVVGLLVIISVFQTM